MFSHCGGNENRPPSPSRRLNSQISTRVQRASATSVAIETELLPSFADATITRTMNSCSFNEPVPHHNRTQPAMSRVIDCIRHVNGFHASTIRFSDDSQIRYYSDDEISFQRECKKDLWYRKSELVEMRKLDRDMLLAALRAVAAATTRAHPDQVKDGGTESVETPNIGSISNETSPSTSTDAESDRHHPPPPPPPSQPSRRRPELSISASEEEFCIRGLEVVINKRERDETKKRALHIVLNEQERNRCKDISGTVRVNDKPTVATPEFDVPLETNPRFEVFRTTLSQGNLQERISSRYRLATRQSTDEAYLRGLQDAQEARAIFQQSIGFPSDNVDSIQHSSSYLSTERRKGSLFTMTAGSVGADGFDLVQVLSLKLILQENARLTSGQPWQ